MMANDSLLNLINSFLTLNFSEEEKYLASLIFSKTSELIEDKGNLASYPDEDDDSFGEKLQATKENFREIIRILEEARAAKEKFLKRFPEWGPQRKDNIDKLRKLAKVINTNRHNCNISKITSSVVGILGGIAIGAGIAFPPLGVPLTIGGGISSALGGATVFGTSVTEVVLLKNRMEEAKQVLGKDTESFKLMSLWFKHSQDFINAVEKVIGFSVVQKIFYDVKQSLEQFTKMSHLKNGKIPPSLQKCIELALNHILPDGVAFSALAFAPAIVTFIFIVILLRKNNSIIFESIVFSHHTVLGLLKILDFGGDISMLVCNAVFKAGTAASTDALTKVTARAIAHGTFAAIGVALDITNLVISSVDIHNGSVSENATQIEDAAQKLENEYEVLLKIFNKLV